MLYRRFGRTELRMPAFSCGGMRYQASWDPSKPATESSQRTIEAVLDRALEVGINHIETARGYGTSEAQLGPALARHERSRFILQTKVAPDEDPKRFEQALEQSFARLRVSHLDLFAFHGLNDAPSFDRVLRPGGCYEVVNRFRREGRIRHVGFSTHGPCRLIVQGIETGRFDYVNLHFQYIFQDNRPALEAARRQDMGVFIISPNDKGGRLYRAPEKLRALCAPLSPMAFHDLFLLGVPEIHTLSLGAARPSDFDEHLEAVALFDRRDELIGPVLERLERAYADAVGADFAARWRQGLPDWDRIPGLPNVRYILWLYNLARAYDLHDFARERYANLDGRSHWVPGHDADGFDEAALKTAIAASPFRDAIPGLLREAHALLWDPTVETLP